MIKKVSRWFLVTLGILLMAGVGTVGGIWLWLSSGEREIGSYWPVLAPLALPYSVARNVQVDSFTLWLDQPERRILARAKGVRWTPGGGASLTIPEAVADLNLHRTLSGKGRLELLEMQAPVLRINPDRFDGARKTTAYDMLEAVGRLRISDGRVEMAGAPGESGHALSHIHLTAEHGEKHVQITVKASASSPLGEGELAMQAAYRPVSGRYEAALDIANLDISLLALTGALQPLKEIRIPASGAVRFTGSPDGVEDIAFDLTAGAGRIRLPPVFPAPLRVVSLEAKGHLTDQLQSLHIERFRSDWGGSELSGTLHAANLLDQPSIQASLLLEHFYMDDLQYFWPHTLAPEPRHWVTVHIPRGYVPRATLDVNIAAERAQGERLPDDSIRAEVHFRDLEVNYLPGLPPIAQGEGVARFDARTMDIAVKSARAMDSIQLREGRVVIPDMPAHAPEIDIRFQADAGLQDIARYLSRPVFPFREALAFKPDQVSGTVRADVHLHLPLQSHYPQASIADFLDFDIKGQVLDPQVPSILALPYAIGGGTLNLAVANGGVDAAGTIRMAGLPMEVNARIDMENPSSPVTRYTARTTGTMAELRGFGVPPLEQVSGQAAITVQQEPGAPLRVEANLAQARIALEAAGIVKPHGQPAALRFTLPQAADGATIHVQNLALESAALSFTGSAEVNRADKALKRLDITNFRSGRNQLDATVQPRQPEGLDIAVRAAVIDAAPLLRKWKKPEPSPSAAHLDIALEAATVWGLSDTPLRNFRSRIVCEKGGGCLPIQLQATLNDQPVIASAQEAQGNARRLAARTVNGGGLLRFLDIYTNIGKGTLAFETVIRHHGTAQETSRGEAVLTDFSIIKAPVMAKLLSVASLTGIQDGINDRDISFTSLEIPFESAGGIIRIRDGRCAGPSLGFRFDGTVDQKRSTLDLKGTVIPLYGLNTLVGKTPIIGKVLSGGEDKGVFAMNFTVKGPMSHPEVNTNPLSMVTPGFIREMFSARKKEP